MKVFWKRREEWEFKKRRNRESWRVKRS